MWSRLACLVLVAASAKAQNGTYSVDNAAWDCAGGDKEIAATVDGKPGTINCSTVFNGESFKSAAKIKDECDKTAGTSGTGSCSSDGSTKKPGCILSVKGSPGVFCINAEYFGTSDAENANSPGAARTHAVTGKDTYASDSSNGQPGDPLDYCNTNAYDFSAKGYVNFDAAYCGALPAKPVAATTAAPGCQCQGCKRLKNRDGTPGDKTFGPCKYNGPSYDNLCTDVNTITGQCPEVPDDKTTVEDCCATTTAATTTPAGNSTDCVPTQCGESEGEGGASGNKTAGPCLLELGGVKLCMPYQNAQTKKCGNFQKRCEDICDLSAASARCGQRSTTKASAPTTSAKDHTQCTNCYADTKGQCETIFPVANSGGRNYCLDYITGTKNFEILFDADGYPDQKTGPQCLKGTQRCGNWTTSTSTTSTSTTSSTSTSTAGTPEPRYDPGLPELREALNALITAWEYEEGCRKNRPDTEEAKAAKLAANAVTKMLKHTEVNEGIIRNYMTNGFYLADQKALYKDYYGTEMVGAADNERVCAEYNQTCTCKGLTRFQSVPATSWGTYRCLKSTFEKASEGIIFEPALSNKNVQCFCRSDADVQQDYELQKVARLFELARQVGATRRCDGKGPRPLTTNQKANNDGPQHFLLTTCDNKKCGRDQTSKYTFDVFNTTSGLDCRRKAEQVKCAKASVDLTLELEDVFNEIFRVDLTPRGQKVQGKRITTFNPEYTSKGGLAMADEAGIGFQRYYTMNTASVKANAKGVDLEFETLGKGKDFNFARGTRVAYRTESCQKGGIKNLLGMCECTGAVFAKEEITVGPPPPPTTTGPATTVTIAVNCDGRNYEGPLENRKALKSDQLKCEGANSNQKTGACFGMTKGACAAKCTAESSCKAYSYKDDGGNCFLSTSNTTDKLQITSTGKKPAWNHYVKSKACLERTTAKATASTTPSTGSISPLDGVIVGSECLPETSYDDIESACETKCTQQHECEGYLLYWEEKDTVEKCQSILESKQVDPFEELALCGSAYNSKCAKCSTHDSCQELKNVTTGEPICSNVDASSDRECFACLPCLHPTVKNDKCSALYSSVVDDKTVDEVVGCILLQNVCTDNTKGCLNDGGNSTGGLPAGMRRGVSKWKEISTRNDYEQYPTHTSTATSTGTSTATSTATSSLASTATTTATSTAFSTETTSGTSTATSTGVSTETTSATSSQTMTRVTTKTFTSTQTTTATSTVTTTARSTVTTTATSTAITKGPDYEYVKVYETGLPNQPFAGRRFGNAFNKQDRIFYLRYDIHDQDKGMQDKENVLGMCKERCSEERLCMGVFIWNQEHHVKKEDRRFQGRPTGYSCVGLNADAVHGNFFSYATTSASAVFKRTYADFVTEIEQAGSLNSTLRHEDNPLVSKIFKEGDSPMENVPNCIGVGCVIQGFTGESESHAKRIECDDKCTYYTGACIHAESGFCMNEVPGTAQCLKGFQHCNEEFFCNWDGCKKGPPL